MLAARARLRTAPRDGGARPDDTDCVSPALRPWLAALVVLQWACVAVYAATTEHNGWLWYQGGDHTYYLTSASLLNDAEVARTGISYLWPYVIAPLALPFGLSTLEMLPAVVLFNLLVLLPLGPLCVYGIVARIGGRTYGLAAAALWAVLPYLAVPLWVERYHERYTEQIMPQFLGLTAMADFPSMVAVLCAAYCCFRAIDERDGRWAAFGGLLAGLAVGLKPANALFLAGPALAFAVWRPRLVLPFGAAVLPGLVGLALWKLRALGSLPVAAGGEAHLAVSFLAPLERYGGVDLDRLDYNLDALREYFWTVRLLEWAAVAGVVAVARRSGPKAAFLGAWLAAFVLVKGGAEQASVDAGSFFRLLLPAFPAFFLLAVAVPLLVPGAARRLAPQLRGAFDGRFRRLGLVVGVIALLQLVTLPLLSTVPQGKAVEDSVSRVMAPVDPGLTPVAARTAAGVRLTWPAPGTGGSSVFYRVLRARPDAVDVNDQQGPRAIDGVRCLNADRGAPACELQMTLIGLSRSREWVDRAPRGQWVYRVAAAANYADDPLLGDMLLLSPPVRVTVP